MSNQSTPQQPPAQPQSQVKKLLQSVGTAAIAAVITVSFIHPIDVIKTRLQISGEAGRAGGEYNGVFQSVKKIYSENGIKTFYKGISAAYLREMSYTSLRLGLYSPVKDFYAGPNCKDPSAFIKFISGATSGAIAASAGNPFDVLKTRMMASEVKGLPMSHYAGELYTHQGLKGFYKGLSANISRGVVLNSTKLGTYDIIKTNLNKAFGFDGLPLHFFSAFTAGFFMTCTVTPFDMVRTRLMNQPKDKQIYSGLVDCFSKVIKNEGATSLYKGFFPIWGRFAPTTVLQLVILEQLRKVFGMKQI